MPINSIGNLGENIAAHFLIKNGYIVLEKNFTNIIGKKMGEIDIIALQKNEIVFIEVKTRMESLNYTLLPEDAINKNKLKKIHKIASYYIKRNNIWQQSYRFDAISVIIHINKKTASVRHLKHIYI
jgi:putative endonuclease